MTIELHTTQGIKRKQVGYSPNPYSMEKRVQALELRTQKAIAEYTQLYAQLGVRVRQVYVYHQSRMNNISPKK